MKVLFLVLSSVVAVSVFGWVLLRRPAPDSMPVAEAQPVVEVTEFQPLEAPVPPETKLEPGNQSVEVLIAEPLEVRVEEQVAETPDFKPVQTLEERGDAMLFESQALMDTPFDQSISMPFDNL